LQRGFSVVVVEGQSTAGGGARCAALTLPGFSHDVCSAVHPLGYGSPIFRTFPLTKHGLEWLQPTAPYAHPFDNGEAVVVRRSIEETAEEMGVDRDEYLRFMRGLVPQDWDQVCSLILAPYKLACFPVPLARFGLAAIQSARSLVHSTFRDRLARGTFAGVAAHSALKMDDIASASFGVVLGLAAHAVGWPIPRGGSQSLSHALISYMVSLGGELVLSAPVNDLADIPEYNVWSIQKATAEL
jgi:phytoene dehydrogenase-like protein